MTSPTTCILSALLTGAIAATFASPVCAQNFNLDVGDDLGVPSAAYGGAAGQPGPWNAAVDSTAIPFSVTDLVRADGMPSTVDFTRSAVNCVGCSSKNNAMNPLTLGDEELLMDDFYDLGVFTSSATWTFDGLEAGQYSVYTYAWAPDGPNFSTSVDVVGSTGPVTVGGAWAGQQQGVTYALHLVDLAAGSPLIIDTMTSSAFGTVNGFQIVQRASAGTNYCFGDGGDQMGCTPCRCGNEAPIGTIGGCLNSAGTSGRLDAFGTPSVANDSLRLEMRSANPSTFGILLSGGLSSPPPGGACPPGSGTLNGPALDGLRCVRGTVLRHGTRATDANGDVGVTNNGWGPPNGPAGGLIAANAFAAGQTRFFQVFYREDALLGCMTAQNTTNGVEVLILP